MSLLFIEGFDYYNDNQLYSDNNPKWLYQTVNTGNVVAGLYNKHPSGQYLELQRYTAGNPNTLSSTTGIIATGILGGIYSGVIGFAVNMRSIVVPTTVVTGYTLLSLNNSVNATNVLRLDAISFQPAQTYTRFVLHDNTKILASGTRNVSLGEWHYIELKFVIANSIPANEMQLRIDGWQDCLVAGATDTYVLTSNQNAIGRFKFFSTAATYAYPSADYFPTCIDDIYVVSLDNDFNRDFMGEITVLALHPNANGDLSQLVGTDLNSTDNYLNVDELKPELGTAVNSGYVAENADIYNYQGLPENVKEIRGIQIVSFERSADEGIRNVSPLIKAPGYSIRELGKYDVNSTSFQFDTGVILDKNIDTNLPWTVADIEGIQAGIRLKA